jgi:thiol-disulfide isomerase/thioredoxin
MIKRLVLSVSRMLLLACMAVAGSAYAADVRLGQTPVLPVLTTLDGKSIDPSSLRGKVIVISYFASYCPFCANEAPKLQKLYSKNTDKLIVIGVNVETKDPQQKEKAQQWVRKYQLTHPVTTDFPALERVLGKRQGLPINYVFDKRGMLRRVDVGEIFDEDFDDIARFAQQD